MTTVLAALCAALAILLLVPHPAARLRGPGGIRVGIDAVARWRRAKKEGDPDAALAHELPDALEFLGVCLEVGLPMSRAVATVAAVSPSATRGLLDEVSSQMALGRAGPLAWESLKEHPVWGRAAMDISRAERSGTALVGVLRLHAEDARQEVRDLVTKKARTVGVRSMIPLMACFLPAFLLVGVVPIVAGLVKDLLG